MEMSVREARAQFAHALSAAENGERVTITKNGKPIAELGPPTRKKAGFDWERNERVRRELGLDKLGDVEPEADGSIPFTGPAWTQEVWGGYFTKLDREFAEE